MKALWNDRFSRDEYIYGEQPNVFFSQQLQKYTPGSLLLPGEGEGRNAVWAARMGWKVTAVDYSEAGKTKALKLAERYKVQLNNYIISDLGNYFAEPESFDAIALVFIHMEPSLREKIHRMLADALKPGGILILEAFSTGQIAYDSGGPKDPDLLYTTEILKCDFEALNIHLLENCTDLLSEGNYHQGKASLVRMLANK